LFTEFVESSLNQYNNALIAGYSIIKLKSFHDNNEDIGPLMQWKIDGARPFRSEIEKYSPATRHYCPNLHNISFKITWAHVTTVWSGMGNTSIHLVK
jgi:hypothetical protein